MSQNFELLLHNLICSFLVERLPPVLVLDANHEIDEMGAQYKKHENVLRGLEPYTAANNSILS